MSLGGNYGAMDLTKGGARADVLRPLRGSFSLIERQIKQNISFPTSARTMKLSISTRRTHAASREQKKKPVEATVPLDRMSFALVILTEALLQKVEQNISSGIPPYHKPCDLAHSPLF